MITEEPVAERVAIDGEFGTIKVLGNEDQTTC